MSKKQAERIVKARDNAPERLRGADFDAWLLDLLLETLEPAQRDLLEFLLIGVGNDVPVSTEDLCGAFGTTANRMGATIARLRRLHLIMTTHRNDEHGRSAYHAPAAWVRLADRYRLQMAREAWAATIRELRDFGL